MIEGVRVVLSVQLEDAEAAQVLLEPPAVKAADPPPDGGAQAAGLEVAEAADKVAGRLSRTSAFVRWNNLRLHVQSLEQQIASGGAAKEKARTAAELDEARAELAEAEAVLAELQATFESDPLALSPWMCALFSLADAGIAAFEAAGHGWPHARDLGAVFLAGPTPHVAAPAEQLLGTFRRRFLLERAPIVAADPATAAGPPPKPAACPAILTRLAPNCFAPGFSPDAAVAAAVDRARAAVGGPGAEDGGPSLDLAQLQWLDAKDPAAALPALRALARLAVAAAPAAAGGDEGGVAAVLRVAAIGLVDPPFSLVQQALRAGVPLVCVQLRYSLVEPFEAQETVANCLAAGIPVFARGTTAGGLLHERWLGAAAPPLLGAGAARAALDAVAAAGGWARFQRLLARCAAVGARRGVPVAAVAARWAIDRGVIPIIEAGPLLGAPSEGSTTTASVGPSGGEGGSGGGVAPPDAHEAAASAILAAFGGQAGSLLPRGAPAVPPGLFATESFLTAEDSAELLAAAAVGGEAEE